jgi:hypothetical protein
MKCGRRRTQQSWVGIFVPIIFVNTLTSFVPICELSKSDPFAVRSWQARINRRFHRLCCQIYVTFSMCRRISAAYTKNEAKLPYDSAFGFVRCSHAQQSAARCSSSDTPRISVSFRRPITGSNSPERFLRALRLVPCCCRWRRNDSRSFSRGACRWRFRKRDVRETLPALMRALHARARC